MTTHDLPPGQIETQRFPVVGERVPSAELASSEDWFLKIHGLVDRPMTLRYEDYERRNQSDLTFDVHCVTSWTRLATTFTGVPLSDLLDEVRPHDDAVFISFTSFSDRGHHTSLPLSFARDNSWLVHSVDGEPLETAHGGPVRVVTPGKYFYKSIKWVKTVELLTHDRLGWWETNSSYHNNADPRAGDERFTTGSLRPDQLERFLSAARYDKYRGRVLLGLDLRRWQPATEDLRRLYLKNCDLSGLDLSGSDLRESNLSLSRMTGALLRGADLSGSDLEGADFTGADLRNADLSGTALSAARFDGARVEGSRFEGSWGLVESQQSYLTGQGVPLDS